MRLNWRIKTIKDQRVVATYKRTSDYPLGVRKQYFVNVECKEEGRLIQAASTVVKRMRFLLICNT